MFNGTFAGNLIGILYFVLFLAGGVWIARWVFSSFKTFTRIWLGTVIGTVLLMWLPILFSFLFGFNILSHILGAVLLVLCCGAAWWFNKGKKTKDTVNWKSADTWLLIGSVTVMTAFFTFLQINHIMAPSENGGYLFGQSTYNDANIHLSFITTPVAQGTVPFVYNILPSQQASYPFLSDTVSSSIYIWGASLRWSYILPTVVGAFNVFAGAFLFFELWLKSAKKALLAFVLFFFNGGFGFAYFFDGLKTDTGNFTRIFTELYQTPTNLDEKMIRFVNTICDMMVPQRATLFGWMMLFAVLYLLYRATFYREKHLFVPAGILAGATPLISTHIFLSLGLIAAVWMMSRLAVKTKMKKPLAGWIALALAALGVVIFAVSCLTSGKNLTNFDYDTAGMRVLIVVGGLIALLYVLLIVRTLDTKGGFRELLTTWGLFLGIVLVLALPQLIAFTFKQSGNGNGFLTPHFNWVNSRDEYIWFYIKNIGVPALLLIPAVLQADHRQRSILAPIALLMLLAETFSLQPNTYDNNKLIYPAFVLACGGVAEYMCVLWEKLRSLRGSRIIAGVTLVACTLSGVLSMGREAVSNTYQILSEPEITAAAWINDNTPGNAVFLTNDRLYHEITDLTGRNIVCGGGWLFWAHGLPNHDAIQVDVKAMYEQPDANRELFEKYHVDYVVISGSESYSFTVDRPGIEAMSTKVYDQFGYTIYQLNK